MKDSEKNIITHESCRELIKNANRGEIPFYTLIFAVALLVFVPIIVLCIKELFDMLALAVVLSLLLAIFPVCAGVKLISVIKNALHEDRAELLIVTDTVLSLSKGELSRKRRGTADVIYFAKYGRVEAGGVYFDLAEAKDVFYIVLLDKKVVMIYPSSIYTCNELD